MTGPLKCGWGCGSRFYNADEQQAHEAACAWRPSAEPSAEDGGADEAHVLEAVIERPRAA